MSPPRRRRGAARRRVGVVALLLVAASPLAGVSPARAAAAITAQAVADHGAFLDYAPPPQQAAGLCLVDTGVDVNPDTQTSVTYRTAIDGGSGSDADANKHGTLLAMLASAPVSNWGIAGAAPGAIRIVSVRILEPGQATFPFAYYTDAIDLCLELQPLYDIKVINLSLGTSQVPSSADYAAISNAVAQANDYGVDVVAAAGNDTGGPIDYPAALPAVLSVGALDTSTGGFCSLSNRGIGLRLLAPGCDLTAPDPATGAPSYDYYQGTSEASAIAAAALAALRAYQPALTPQAAEALLTAAENGTLDIASTFDNAGLADIVNAGTAAEPPQTTSPPAPSAAEPSTPAAQPTTAPAVAPPAGDPASLATLPTPTVRFERRSGRTVVVCGNRPAQTNVQLRLLGYRRRRMTILRRIQTSANEAAIDPTGVVEIAARYQDSYDRQRNSPWTIRRIAPPSRP